MKAASIFNFPVNPVDVLIAKEISFKIDKLKTEARKKREDRHG